MGTAIFSSFTIGLSESISEIDTDTPRTRFSKKRKFDETNYVIDDHAIIYDTESDSDSSNDEMYDDDDINFDFIADDFRVWRRNYIRKYKCKK